MDLNLINAIKANSILRSGFNHRMFKFRIVTSIKICICMVYLIQNLADVSSGSPPKKANPAKAKKDAKIVSTRIIGGRPVKPHSLQYQLAVLFDNKIGCGAAIIHPHYALTAAHCTLEQTPSDIKVIAGGHDLKKLSGKEVLRQIVEIQNHPNYSTTTQHNDISILRFKDPLVYNAQIKPILMPDPTFKTLKGQATVSGWGHTKESGDFSDVLRKVSIPIVHHPVCQKVFEERTSSRIGSNQICAGSMSGGKDGCQGDSGGPLVITKDKKYLLVGIVSFGFGCGRAGFPGVYTEVAKFRKWIDGIISRKIKKP